MTLNELAFNILNKMTGGRSTHNEYISLDQIKFNINYYRSLLIHRDIRRSQNTDLFEQLLCPISFKRHNINTAGEHKTYLKSVKEIPQIVRYNYEYPLHVYFNEQGESMPVETYHRAWLQDYNRFTAKKPRCYLKEKHLYVTKDVLFDSFNDDNDDTIYDFDNVMVQGIFENPSEVHIFNGKDPLTVDDQPYPVPGDMAQRISESLINGDFQLMLQTPNDITHDTIPPAPKGMGGN